MQVRTLVPSGSGFRMEIQELWGLRWLWYYVEEFFKRPIGLHSLRYWPWAFEAAIHTGLIDSHFEGGNARWRLDFWNAHLAGDMKLIRAGWSVDAIHRLWHLDPEHHVAPNRPLSTCAECQRRWPDNPQSCGYAN